MTLNRVVETNVWSNRKNEGNKYGFFGGECDDKKQYPCDGFPSEVGSRKEVAITLLEAGPHRWADYTGLVTPCDGETAVTAWGFGVPPSKHHFDYRRSE
ncbi:MAG: hypothetical protein ACTSYB_07895 [Candidatus Helarchaeota archaeon]